MSERRVLSVEFGAFADRLVKQLRGFRLSAKDVALWEADAGAVLRLKIRGLISEGQADMARRRIMGQIRKAINATPPLADRVPPTEE